MKIYKVYKNRDCHAFLYANTLKRHSFSKYFIYNIPITLML